MPVVSATSWAGSLATVLPKGWTPLCAGIWRICLGAKPCVLVEKRRHPMTEQLLREWPPGYGGVERVAHELAAVWGGTVWSFDAQGFSSVEVDALDVTYSRRRLPCTPPVARVRFPLLSPALWQLLCSMVIFLLRGCCWFWPCPGCSGPVAG